MNRLFLMHFRLNLEVCDWHVYTTLKKLLYLQKS